MRLHGTLRQWASCPHTCCLTVEVLNPNICTKDSVQVPGCQHRQQVRSQRPTRRSSPRASLALSQNLCCSARSVIWRWLPSDSRILMAVSWQDAMWCRNSTSALAARAPRSCRISLSICKSPSSNGWQLSQSAVFCGASPQWLSSPDSKHGHHEARLLHTAVIGSLGCLRQGLHPML